MTDSRDRTSEEASDQFTLAQQFAQYGLAQCCACRRILPRRYLGPLDPLGQQRCVNWSDCRDARALAEAYLSQNRKATAAAIAGPDVEEAGELGPER
jgi:hypothetical protein